MAGIILTMNIKKDADDSKITAILKKYDCTENSPTQSHQIWVLKGDGITVTKHKTNLLIQGRHNNGNLNLIRDLNKLDFIELEGKNQKKYRELFESKHNSIVCQECYSPSIMLIEGIPNESNLVFMLECGHESDTKPPIYVCNYRILPDASALIAGFVSKSIILGHFENFEIVFPKSIMKIVDTLCGKKQKKGFSNEIKALRALEKEGKIRIFQFNDNLELPDDKNKLENDEDEIILHLAHLTGSLLFTSDRNLKDRAIVENRPSIYIDPKYSKEIKILLN